MDVDVEILLVGNDQTIEVLGVRDAVSGDFINTAIVEATIKDSIGREVAGETWPITLGYVVDSDGDYRGNLEDGIDLRAGKSYSVEVKVDAGGDLIGFWKFTRYAKYREP